MPLPAIPGTPRHLTIPTMEECLRSFDENDPWRFILARQNRESKMARKRIPDSVRKAVHERDGHACLHCGATERLTLDHIIPWSMCGPDTVENLQTLCKSCNSKKGAKS